MFEALRGNTSVRDSDSTSDGAASAGGSDLSALREEVENARKTRSDKGQRRTRRVSGVAEREVTEEEVQELFKAENWEALASLPFDTRYIMTGWEGFRLSEEERKRLASTTAITMKILLKIDPKYIALTVWGTLYFGTWAAKEAAYSNVKTKAAAARKTITPGVGQGSPHPNAA